MTKRVLSYGVIGLLAVALLAGVGYILLNPEQVQAEQGSPGGRGQGRGAAVESGGSEPEVLNRNAGRRSETAQGRRVLGDGAFGTEPAFDGRGQSSGTGQGRNETVRTVEWETLTGEVAVVDSEITVQTAEGDVLVGMGQALYREGFALEVGNEVSVTGFHEDGEFKAGTIENLTTGETLVLRDETGRPMWAGRGRLKNQRQS
ncbi:MAG: hypothetical protein SWK90_17955 [Chloroflexota bacterium]|nr:hypothetical protein [Chloroflexota bacterium]